MARIGSYPESPDVLVEDNFIISRRDTGSRNYNVSSDSIRDFVKKEMLEDGTISLAPTKKVELDNVANGVALKSPDGTIYRVTVGNDGSIATSPYSAAFLSSSWGVRFNVNGGSLLDSTSNYNWTGGVNQIVDKLTSVGHIITNFTHPAKGMYYTLRTNARVNVAAIHQAMVPSIENENIIINAINTFKDAGKKVILYVNAGGPSTLQSGSSEELDIQAAWEAYCDENFSGDLGAGWRELAKGYFERFRDLGVDGYWIDNLANLPGGDTEAFVNMIRGVDPNAALATNLTKSYVEREGNPGVRLKVDSDGINDNDPTDYNIFVLEANDPYMDFTSGHPTPLGQGAPPNSWAYEEYTIPLATENVWSSYDGSKQALKHGFFPIRDLWSVSTANLVFEVEQAYRFVRNFTDSGAAITWSTTITNGFITSDEMDIMVEINERMLKVTKPNFKPYVRPVGASLAAT